jgi:signal transduction histidine kinase
MAGVRLLGDPSAYLRMVFVLIGSGLALSFGLLDATVIASLVLPGAVPIWIVVLLGTLLVAAPIVGFGLVPASRSIEAAAAESLLGVRFPDGTPGPALDWAQRRRSLGWFVCHLLAGAVPVALVLLALAVGDPAWVTVCGVAALVATFALGQGLAALAPSLLGPSRAERIAALERDVHRAVQRNRIAREIHDGVGHALSLVTVQAAAARRVIDRDPRFAAAALDAIEQAARSATADLDQALGLLREDGSPSRHPAPDLSAVATLLATIRSAGLQVRADVPPDIAGVRPAAVSREAYRIVQEALTNALRYADPPQATVTIELSGGDLRVTVDNPAAPPSGRRRTATGRTGRGLRGIEERAAALGGTMTAGPVDGRWRLAVRLPVTGGAP